MLASIVIELEAPRALRAKPNGRHAHGAVLAEIERVDPALAAELHGGRQRRRPFTAWVGPRFRLSGGRVRVDAGPATRYWLRTTGLDERVSRALATIAERPPEAVMLDGQPFPVTRLFAAAEEHSWSGALGYDEIIEYWRGHEPSGRVRLRFLSPTAFGGHGDDPEFPGARLVVTSLIRRWNELSGRAFSAECCAELASASAVADPGMSIAAAEFGTHRLQGFAGACDCVMPSATSVETRRALHVLADFAFFAGVGTKTAMGMGQTICESHQ